MKHFTTLCFILITFSLQAQVETLIIGKWVFNDIPEEEKTKMDSMGQVMLVQLFGDMAFYFKENKHYKVSGTIKEDEGTWELSADQKTMKMSSNKGEFYDLQIKECSKDQMLLGFATGTFIMGKVVPTTEDEVETKSLEIETVAATTKQIAKKWMQQVGEAPKLTEELKEVTKELIKGNYLQLNADGTCTAKSGMGIGIGTWAFGEGNKSIILSIEGEKQSWSIHAISDTELVLLKGLSADKWYFSAK